MFRYPGETGRMLEDLPAGDPEVYGHFEDNRDAPIPVQVDGQCSQQSPADLAVRMLDKHLFVGDNFCEDTRQCATLVRSGAGRGDLVRRIRTGHKPEHARENRAREHAGAQS